MSSLTDLNILRALHSVKDKLTSGEATSFRRMLEDLERGTVVRLSKKQRIWVEQKYHQLNLGQLYRDTPPPKAKKIKVPPVVFPWEANPSPMKPPGRS